MSTCTGQNLGAGEYRRARDGKNKCLIVAASVTLAISAAVFFLREESAALFNRDPEVIRVAVGAILYMVPFLWCMAVREVLLGYLRGCGRNRMPMLLSLIGMIGVRQAFLALSMHLAPSVRNLYVCYPVGWVSTTLLLIGYYLIVRKNLLPKEA